MPVHPSLVTIENMFRHCQISSVVEWGGPLVVGNSCSGVPARSHRLSPSCIFVSWFPADVRCGGAWSLQYVKGPVDPMLCSSRAVNLQATIHVNPQSTGMLTIPACFLPLLLAHLFATFGSVMSIKSYWCQQLTISKECSSCYKLQFVTKHCEILMNVYMSAAVHSTCLCWFGCYNKMP